MWCSVRNWISFSIETRQRDVGALQLLLRLVQGKPYNGIFTSIILYFYHRGWWCTSILYKNGGVLQCAPRWEFIFLFIIITIMMPSVTIKDSTAILIVIY